MAGENAVRTNGLRNGPSTGTDGHLRVYGIHSARKPDRHEYEFYISYERNRKVLNALQGRISFSLPISAFLPKARDAIRNEYGRGDYAHPDSNARPTVRLGMISFRVAAAGGRNVAYSLNYKPKGEINDPIQIESRGTGMGGHLESLCLNDLRRVAGATHVTTTAGAIRYLSGVRGFEDEVGMLGSFTDSESRLGQLRKCGICPADVVEIGRWARLVSGLHDAASRLRRDTAELQEI